MDTERGGPGRELEAFSLDRLIALALGEALIEAFEQTDHEVVLVQGANRFKLPHRQAAVFLVGMLRGRSWYLNGDEPPAVVRRPRHAEAPPDATAPPAAAAGAGQGPLDANARSVETTLDALVAFAREAGIIQRFEKDPHRRTARIQIPACTSTMSYAEAVAFLFDCVQDYVRAGGPAATPP